MTKDLNKNNFISEYYKVKGVGFKTNAELANILGYKSGNSITEIIKGRQQISTESYLKFTEQFKNILEGSYKKSLNEVTQIPYSDYMMVEYVDLSASAGPLGGANLSVLPESKKRLVPKEFERGNYLVIRVNGDSMDDGTSISIPDGSEVLVKEHLLEPGEKLPIRNNLFVITSRDGNVFKQVVEHNLEHGFLKCRSYNRKYKDFIIPLEDVFQVFVYRKIVSLRPSIPEID